MKTFQILPYEAIIIWKKSSSHIPFKEEWFGKTVGLYKYANSQSWNDKV